MRSLNKLICLSVIALSLTACGGADERKAAYMERGMELVAEENYEKAKLEFKNALQIDPKDANAHYQLGLVLEKLTEFRPAMSQFLATLKLDENHTDAHVHAGQFYLLANDLDKSLESAEAALNLEPENQDALALRGGVRAKSGDITGAFSDGLKALKLEPGHLNAIALLSSLHLSQKDPAKALALINKGEEFHAKNTNLLTLKAKVQLVLGEPDAAGVTLEEIVTNEPDEMNHRYQLGSFYISQKHLDKAEATFRDAAAKDDSDDHQATMVLIEFLAKYRDIDAAEKELLAQVEKNPEASEFLFGLAQLYKSKDAEKSIEVLNRIVDQNKYGAPEGLKAKSQIAVLKMSQKKFDEAEKLAEEVLVENAKDTESLTVRGTLALMNKKAPEAIADFRSILNADPTSVRHLRLLARAHGMNGEMTLAREALEQAVEAAPKDAVVRSELAEVLLRVRKPEQAIDQIQEVLAIAPDNAAALETLFKLQSAKKDWRSALETAEKIKEAFPDKGEGYHLSGLAQQMNNDFTSSIDNYTKALEKAPNAAQPLAQLVRGFMANNQADEALARVEKVLEANPKNHVALNMKGEILFAQKKVAEARDVFRFAIKTKPDFRTPYASLARSYLVESNLDEAIKAYQAGVKVLPNDPILVTGLASTFVQNEQVDKAVGLYEGILEKEPKNVISANNLAMIYIDRVNTPESIGKAQKLLSVLEGTNNTAYLDTIGWVHYKAGNYSQAISILEKAVSSLPKEPVLQYHLGMAYFKDGNVMSLAKNHLELAINSGRNFLGKDEAEEALKSIQ